MLKETIIVLAALAVLAWALGSVVYTALEPLFVALAR